MYNIKIYVYIYASVYAYIIYIYIYDFVFDNTTLLVTGTVKDFEIWFLCIPAILIFRVDTFFCL